MSVYKVDASDEGRAAQIVWAAVLLFCKTSGMNAENAARAVRGEAMAYNDAAYFYEADAASAALGTRKEV